MILKKTQTEGPVMHNLCDADGCHGMARWKVRVSWEVQGYKDVDYQCDDVSIYVYLCDECYKSVQERD